MKPTLKTLRVGELSELERLVTEHAESLEAGLKILDSRACLGAASCLIGRDARGSLVIIAPAIVADERVIVSALDAYSWCLHYPDQVERLAAGSRVSATARPRVIVVAERMTDAFLRIVEHLGSPSMHCHEFRYVEVNGTPTLYFDPVNSVSETSSPAPESDARAAARPRSEEPPAPRHATPRAEAPLRTAVAPPVVPPPVERATPPAAPPAPTRMERPAPAVEPLAAPIERYAPPIERPAPPIERAAPPIERHAPPLERPAPQLERPAPQLERPAPPIQRSAPVAQPSVASTHPPASKASASKPHAAPPSPPAAPSAPRRVDVPRRGSSANGRVAAATRLSGVPAESKMRAVREYLQHEFPACILYDYYEPDRAGQIVHLQNSQGTIIHQSFIDEDFLNARADGEVRAFLEKHKFARALRDAGLSDVHVTGAGFTVERR